MLPKDKWDIVFHSIQTVTAIGTAVWAFWRFGKERTHTSHIELKLDCKYFGPQSGQFLTEIVITAKNAGRVYQQFDSIRLRVRGIRCNYPLTYWKGYEPRVDFPDKLLSNDKFIEVIPRDMKWNYIFVEPGVEQEIKYLTLIPSEYRFICVNVTFLYDKTDETKFHSAERVFELGSRNPVEERSAI